MSNSTQTRSRGEVFGPEHRAYDMVRSQIRSGWVPAGGTLTENELVTMTGLPRGSVRAALSRLVDEGLIVRQRHVGTRVLGSYYCVPVDDSLPSNTPAGFMYRKLSDRVIPMVPWVSRALDCDDATVGVVEQMFEHVTADGAEPVGLRTAYYRTSYTQPQSWPSCPSLEFAFEFVFGAALGEVETVIDATTADQATARLLHISVGSPLLVREQRYIDVNGVVQEYGFSHYRADRVSFPLRDQRGQFPDVLLKRSETPDTQPHRSTVRSAS